MEMVELGFVRLRCMRGHHAAAAPRVDCAAVDFQRHCPQGADGFDYGCDDDCNCDLTVRQTVRRPFQSLNDLHYCLFTDPELARIGLSETEAEAQGKAYRLFKVPMETNLRARTLSETRGFVKALVEADGDRGDRIIGFTAFGVGAGEILAAVQVAMIAGLPYTALRDAVLTHPTLVEGLIPLFSSAASTHNVAGARGARISAAK
jgi:hypothetical protein